MPEFHTISKEKVAGAFGLTVDRTAEIHEWIVDKIENDPDIKTSLEMVEKIKEKYDGDEKDWAFYTLGMVNKRIIDDDLRRMAMIKAMMDEPVEFGL